jgi:hypothetical protein
VAERGTARRPDHGVAIRLTERLFNSVHRYTNGANRGIELLNPIFLLDLIVGNWLPFATKWDRVPNPFMKKIESQLRKQIGNSRTRRYFRVPIEKEHDDRGRDGTQQAIGDGFGDAARGRFHWPSE